MPDVFLSYSRDDQAIARHFAEGLEREGFSVWWDQALEAGEAFDRVTEKALEEARAVVVLWSKRSADSNWVRAEATQAQASHRLVPVTIEPCKRPIMFELTQTLDLSGWQGDAEDPRWRAFVNGLRRMLGRSSAPAAGATSAVAGGNEGVGGGTAGVTGPAATASRRKIGWAAAAVAIAAAAGLAWFLHGRQNAPAAAHDASIAVLPFNDMSPQKDQGYFADGVAEEILNSLARIPDPNLKVISRNSSFVFRDASNLKEVGAQLGVDHVLEGSVRKSGDQLRVTAQLIDTRTDAHLWSKTFDRPLQDVFEVQEEIASSVAESLQMALGVGTGRARGMTRDVEAYDLYLEAISQAVLFTPETLRRSIALMEQATARDPGFAMAWRRLSGLYGDMPAFVTGSSREWSDRSDAAFEQFRRLFPDSPEVHYRSALRAFREGRTKEALEHEGQARMAAERLGIRTEPGLPTAALRALGHTREAIARLEQEKARDPLNPELAFFLAHSYSEAGDPAAAFAETGRGYRLGGTWSYLMASAGMMTALGARDRGQLVHWLTLLTTTAPSAEARAANAMLLAQLDRPAEALAALRAQARNPSTTPLDMATVAPWLAYHGDAPAALEALRIARQRARGATSAWSAVYRDVRRLDDFKQMVREEGLVDVWREVGWGDHCKPVGEDDFECH